MVQNAPCWREKRALGQDKQSKLQFKIMYVFCLSFPRATFALQHDGFVPRDWLAAKGLLQRLAFQVGGWAMVQCPIPVKKISLLKPDTFFKIASGKVWRPYA